MNRYIYLLFYALALVACNRNAVKLENAKQKLEQFYKDDPKQLQGTLAFEAVIRGKDSNYNNILFRQYIGAGLLKLKEKITVADTPIYVYQITEANSAYVIKKMKSKYGYPIFVVKTFDYYVDQVTDTKYSPDELEAAVKFNLSIRNLTPFGKDAADPNHKMFLIGFFKLVNNIWQFDRIELDIDKL